MINYALFVFQSHRRSEPATRPHSWHSTKLSEGQPEVDPGAMDTMCSAWHHSYHSRSVFKTALTIDTHNYTKFRALVPDLLIFWINCSVASSQLAAV